MSRINPKSFYFSTPKIDPETGFLRVLVTESRMWDTHNSIEMSYDLNMYMQKLGFGELDSNFYEVAMTVDAAFSILQSKGMRHNNQLDSRLEEFCTRKEPP